MEDKIISKKYYYIEFELVSAFTIGGKNSQLTDRDIVKNSRGEPYIPATALAGIYRSLFCEKEKELYFGHLQNDNDTGEESRLIIYDANIKNQNYHISKRDGVGLDEWKTAKEGAKFDFEIIEPGAVFVTFIEENKYTKEQDAGDMIASVWKNNRMVLGGKTSRGYGETRHIKIQALEFPFGKENQKDIQEWLKFCIYKDELWEKYSKNYKSTIADIKQKKLPDRFCMELHLKQLSPITIRSYTTEKNQNGTDLDYEQIIYVRNSKGQRKEIPVIPGTSWAGAFRHHMIRLKPSCKKFFGEDAKRKSDISFGESEIEGADSKIVTRNAIDRFTGGTADGSLFTEKMYYGGTTVLKITFKENNAESREFVRALAASVCDLHTGILSVGGETSIGHGLFCLTGIRYQGKSILKDNFELGKYPPFSENYITNLVNEAQEIYKCITEKVYIKTGGNENGHMG